MSEHASRQLENTSHGTHTGSAEAGHAAPPARAQHDTSAETSPAAGTRPGRLDRSEGTAVVVDSAEAIGAFEARDADVEDEDFDEDFEEEVLERFAESPEAAVLASIGWSDTVMQYGRDYHGVTIAEMTAAEFENILFDVFPRKVSCEPNEARFIVDELRAFWTFLKRDMGHEQADACIGLLDADAALALERELGNPANFGMAKSFVMGGNKAGFDMSTQAGIDAWMASYNASLTLARPLDAAPAFTRAATPATRRAKKNKRKAQRAARRKNR